MFKVLYLFLLTIFSSVHDLYSQKLLHSYGATISVMFGDIKTSYSTSKLSLAQTNLTYFPRYNVLENENSSISIGLPLGIGVGVASSTDGDDAGIYFAYDLPLVIDYNIGCKSTIENENIFGGYFGIGFGYYKVNISKSQYSDFNGASYGPLFRAGVRIGSYNEAWNGHAFTVGVFYKKGLEKDRLNTIGFNVLYDL